MNTNRIEKYLSLIKKGILQAQKEFAYVYMMKLRLYNVGYTEKVPPKIKGVFSRFEKMDFLEVEEAKIREILSLVENRQLPLLIRTYRGIKNFRRLSKKISKKALIPENLKPNFELLYSLTDEFKRFIYRYMKRIENQIKILQKIDSLDKRNVMGNFISSFYGECVACENLEKKIKQLMPVYNEYVSNTQQEYKKQMKVIRMQDKVEGVLNNIQLIAFFGCVLGLAHSIAALSNQSNPIEVYLGAGFGVFSILTLLGGSAMEEYSETLSRKILKIVSAIRI